MKIQRIISILLLILAGEGNFILPFVLARIFRPTVLDVFQLTNVELGACFSVYGIVALFAYILGGSMADRFSPRLLMGTSLILTALGGFYMATIPELKSLYLLYGYWGFTTIFLFWAAMVKATRLWGGSSKQGIAFGLLDGGRGLVSWAFGLLGVFILNYFIIGEVNEIALGDKQAAYSQILIYSSIIILLIAVAVLLFLKFPKNQSETKAAKSSDLLINYKAALKLPSVWLLMIIILTAYTGYKITDIYSQYANEVMNYDEIAAANIGNNLLGIRIFIGVLVGWLADKSRASLIMVVGFALAIIGALLFASGIIAPDTVLLFGFTIVLVALGVYAVRTLYFAAIDEGHIPLHITGTAVGIISLIGYTPDIFMGPLIGYFLDNYTGELGFQYVFMMLAAFSLIGMIATLIYFRINKVAT